MPGEDALQGRILSPDGERFFLPKESLIRKHAEYSRCYAEGVKLHARHFLLFVAPSKEGGGIQLGTAVSRKVGHAVVRNRLKRLLRECFRLQVLPKHGQEPLCLVAVAKREAGTVDLALSDVSGEILGLLGKFFARREARQ